MCGLPGRLFLAPAPNFVMSALSAPDSAMKIPASEREPGACALRTLCGCRLVLLPPLWRQGTPRATSRVTAHAHGAGARRWVHRADTRLRAMRFERQRRGKGARKHALGEHAGAGAHPGGEHAAILHHEQGLAGGGAHGGGSPPLIHHGVDHKNPVAAALAQVGLQRQPGGGGRSPCRSMLDGSCVGMDSFPFSAFYLPCPYAPGRLSPLRVPSCCACVRTPRVAVAHPYPSPLPRVTGTTSHLWLPLLFSGDRQHVSHPPQA